MSRVSSAGSSFRMQPLAESYIQFGSIPIYPCLSISISLYLCLSLPIYLHILTLFLCFCLYSPRNMCRMSACIYTERYIQYMYIYIHACVRRCIYLLLDDRVRRTLWGSGKMSASQQSVVHWLAPKQTFPKQQDPTSRDQVRWIPERLPT